MAVQRSLNIQGKNRYWKCPEWTQTDLEHWIVKSTPSTKDLPLTLKFWSVSLYNHLFFFVCVFFLDTRLPKIGNALNNPELNLNPQQSKVLTEYLPLRPKFWSVLLYDQTFSRHKVVKNRINGKFTEWPQAYPEHLTALTFPLYTKYLPLVPNCGLFCSTTNGFQDTRLLKIGNLGNVPNYLRLTLEC